MIGTYVSTFQKNPDSWWVIGLLTVVTADYQHAIRSYPPEIDRAVLASNNKEQILGLLSYKGFPAPEMCFKKGVSELVGGIDTSYKMMEDWPLYIKLVKSGYLPVFIERYVLKQGSNGISKNGSKDTLRVRKIFVDDKIRMFKKEIIPCYKDISKDDRAKSKEYFKHVLKKQKYYDCDYIFAGKLRKIRLLLAHPCLYKWVAEGINSKLNIFFSRTKLSYSTVLISGLLSTLIVLFINDSPLELIWKILSSIPFLAGSLASYYIVLIGVVANIWKK